MIGSIHKGTIELEVIDYSSSVKICALIECHSIVPVWFTGGDGECLVLAGVKERGKPIWVLARVYQVAKGGERECNKQTSKS